MGMVLVTGGTGFLGAYTIKALVEGGHSVRAIRRSETVPFFIPADIIRQVEWVEGNLGDVISLEEAMDGVEAIVHAAGKVSFHKKDRPELFDINIDGTATLVNMALERDHIKRFIHVSSVSALGRSEIAQTVTEEKKWEETKSNTSYSISKFRGEMEVWRGIAEGLPAVIVNPTTLLGYGDWNTSSCALFRNAFQEFPWYTEGVNGFVDVRDAARAIVCLLESDVTGERYILNGDNWSFHRLFDTIADGFNKKRPSKEATPFLAGVAWRMEKVKSLFSGRRPLLTKESARVAASRTAFDNGKLLRQFPGFRFTPLEETIKTACAAYLGDLR